MPNAERPATGRSAFGVFVPHNRRAVVRFPRPLRLIAGSLSLPTDSFGPRSDRPNLGRSTTCHAAGRPPRHGAGYALRGECRPGSWSFAHGASAQARRVVASARPAVGRGVPATRQVARPPSTAGGPPPGGPPDPEYLG